jgi:hypothetical protein
MLHFTLMNQRIFLNNVFIIFSILLGMCANLSVAAAQSGSYIDNHAKPKIQRNRFAHEIPLGTSWNHCSRKRESHDSYFAPDALANSTKGRGWVPKHSARRNTWKTTQIVLIVATDDPISTWPP